MAARISPDMAAAREGMVLYRKVGCPRCTWTGYKGRVGIFQLLIMNDELETLAAQNAHRDEIERSAAAAGMRSLWDHGIAKAAVGPHVSRGARPGRRNCFFFLYIKRGGGGGGGEKIAHLHMRSSGGAEARRRSGDGAWAEVLEGGPGERRLVVDEAKRRARALKICGRQTRENGPGGGIGGCRRPGHRRPGRGRPLRSATVDAVRRPDAAAKALLYDATFAADVVLEREPVWYRRACLPTSAVVLFFPAFCAQTTGAGVVRGLRQRSRSRPGRKSGVMIFPGRRTTSIVGADAAPANDAMDAAFLSLPTFTATNPAPAARAPRRVSPTTAWSAGAWPT